MSRLFISFSGGRTSAYMTRELLRTKSYDEIVVLFANTGQEHERTLEFIHNCDKQLGFKTIWLEAVVAARGKGTQAKVVSFSTASRGGVPFEAVIQKYGIPNRNFPHCTRELKKAPMDWYIRNVVGWKRGTYDAAIGIRADEIDRINPKFKAERIVYPLVDLMITKADVLNFWSTMPFDLELPEHLGNCVWCWKKSLRKLLTIAKDEPYRFDFPAEMERLYPDSRKGDEPLRFFRGNKSVADLLEEAKNFTDIYTEQPQPFQERLDLGGSCSESCEIFAEEDA